MVVSGPTMCGKSTYVRTLLNDEHIFGRPPQKVYWFYGQATDDLKSKPGYILHEGLPDSFDYIPPNSVIVLDDLMNEAKDHPGVTNLFTKLVHHKNLFVINITQNFFMRTGETRSRRLNSQYLVLFKNPSDATQIAVIGRQTYLNHPTFLPEGGILLGNKQATR